MKLYFVLLVLSFGLLTSLAGQDISPSVISPNGGTAKNSIMILEWTIGEVAVETIRSGDKMYTEGYHQPSIRVEPYEEVQLHTRSVSSTPGTIRVAPNPVGDLLNIELDLAEEMELIIQLNDISGQLIRNETLLVAKGSMQMDFSTVASGMYVLVVKSTDGQFVRTCKISKI